MSLLQIMSERYTGITQTVAGYAQTGVPLVAAGAGGLTPAGVTDDIGNYYFIPLIVRVFGVSVDRALELFFGGIIVVAFLVGLAGAMFVCRTWQGRVGAVFGLSVIAGLAYSIGDVYVVPASLAAAVVPWVLYAVSDRSTLFSTIAVGAAAGLAIGAGHYVRSHSGTALILFVFMVSLFGRSSARFKRIALSTALIAGVMLPVLGFSRLVSRRDAYLAERNVPRVESRHVFWYAVFLGFGFLSNDHGIRYEDAIAIERARRVSPGVTFGSAEGERILREEVFKLVREDPRLVGQTIFAKCGVLLAYLMAFGGVGLVLALRRVNPLHIDLAFLSAIAFSSLSAMLVMPMASYLTGFMALCVLYGVIGVEHAAARRLPSAPA